jgi:hypothetical protein
MTSVADMMYYYMVGSIDTTVGKYFWYGFLIL